MVVLMTKAMAMNGKGKPMPKLIHDDEVAQICGWLGIQTDMGEEQLRVALQCVALFDKKQQDYGSGNISSSGQLGVATRLQDKVSRMRHLLIKQLKGEGDPVNESLEDTYLDAANYCMIGALLLRGRWE